ncbi:polyprenol monophosphomannose synthase [bacterium]|nr:polyprenol monophosphomannose synthase [bacterium]
MKALICIPTYNERENISPLVEAIFSNVPDNAEVLVIDDNSPDGTGQIADELAAKNPRVNVLHRASKDGLAAAYVAGFKWALDRDYDWIFEMDADFSHDPKFLPLFFETIQTHKWNSVCGSRYVPGGGVSNWSRSRLLLSRLGSLYASFWLGWKVRDWTGGFNSWSKETLKAINLDDIKSRGYCFQIEMKFRCLDTGNALKEVPFTFQERREGHSKMSGDIVSEALVGVANLRLRDRQY